MPQLSETLKVLRVCSSEDLPETSSRDSNYLYFVYDKMKLYFYNSFYSDPFCIVESLPSTNLVENMLYITTTGYVKTYIDYQVYDVGVIENNTSGVPDPTQLALLVSAGTTYFMNAESRYLDLQTRVLELPYQNGSYQLSVNLASQLKIDSNTIIAFNEDSNQFEVTGDLDMPDQMLKIDQYITKPTTTTTLTTTSKVLYCDVKISNELNNCLQVYGNGLYINVADKASQTEMDNVLSAYIGYRSLIDSYLAELVSSISTLTNAVSEETIGTLIDAALVNYESTISDMISKYDSLATQLNTIETDVTTGTDTKIEAAKDDIKSYINQIDNAWEVFSQDLSSTVITYSDSELSAQTSILTEYRTDLLTLRSVDGYTYTIVTEIPASPDSNTVYMIASGTSYNLYLGSDTTTVWGTVDYRVFSEVTALPTTGTADVYYVLYDSTAGTYTFEEYATITDEKDVSTTGWINRGSITLYTYDGDGTETTDYDATTIDSTINTYGLTVTEQNVQNTIMNLYVTQLKKMRNYLEYTAASSLPETGSSDYTYFVIDYDNSLYQVYLWVDTAYVLQYSLVNGALVYNTTT